MFRLPRPGPFTRRLLWTLFGTYVLQLIAEVWAGVPLFQTLALTTTRIDLSLGWRPITYLFVQPAGPESVGRMLLGLLFLWFAIAPFEERFGAARALQLTVVTALAGSLPALAVGIFFPGYLYGFSTVLVGAIAAFAYSVRHAQMSFFGVLPLKGSQLILLIVAFSFLYFLASKNVMELAADLGAIGGGILFVRFMQRPRRAATKRGSEGKLRVIRGGAASERPKYLN